MLPLLREYCKRTISVKNPCRTATFNVSEIAGFDDLLGEVAKRYFRRQVKFQFMGGIAIVSSTHALTPDYEGSRETHGSVLMRNTAERSR